MLETFGENWDMFLSGNYPEGFDGKISILLLGVDQMAMPFGSLSPIDVAYQRI
jgi:hypothetical protein